MDPILSATSRLPFPMLVAAMLTGAVIVGGIGWWAQRRRAARRVVARLRQAADDVLAGVLIPNADSGQIHLEFAVLTRQGIVVVDVRDVAGHVFGSETMQDWTVLARSQRFTFANPLTALYDRVAAVKRIIPDMPVRGVVAFTSRANFSKGFPPNVAILDALLQELASARDATDGPPAELLQAAWLRLGQEASSP
jgi:hypothetical protein